jgi:hypothetical protein
MDGLGDSGKAAPPVGVSEANAAGAKAAQPMAMQNRVTRRMPDNSSRFCASHSRDTKK